MLKESKLYSWIQHNRHAFNLAVIFIIGVLIYSVLISLTHILIGSDDTVFPVQTHPYANVFDWVSYRYLNWSGRIFSEAFVYIFIHLPFIFWKIASILIYSLFVLAVFGYYRLFAQNRS